LITTYSLDLLNLLNHLVVVRLERKIRIRIRIKIRRKRKRRGPVRTKIDRHLGAPQVKQVNLPYLPRILSFLPGSPWRT